MPSDVMRSTLGETVIVLHEDDELTSFGVGRYEQVGPNGVGSLRGWNLSCDQPINTGDSYLAQK